MTCTLLASKVCSRLNCPPLIGMLLMGMIFGENGLRQVTGSLTTWLQITKIPELVLDVGPELRNLALVIILIRAGLGLRKNDLITIGRPALKLSIIPAASEAMTITLLAVVVLDFSILESALLAFVITAVSPAVIVPKMLHLMEHPQHRSVASLTLAAASLDDIFVLAAFGICIKAAQPLGSFNGLAVFVFPLYLLFGLGLGAILGYLCSRFIAKCGFSSAQGCLLTLLIAVIFKESESRINIPYCSLLGVMVMSFVAKETLPELGKALSGHFQNLWVGAELILFLLIGAAVDINVLFNVGFSGMFLLIGGLCARAFGVWLSLRKSRFSKKEQLFVTLSMLPKATVQAAIGGSVLAAVTDGSAFVQGGLRTGEQILACAVLAILVTAPLGAWFIDWGRKRLLHENLDPHNKHV